MTESTIPELVYPCLAACGAAPGVRENDAIQCPRCGRSHRLTRAEVNFHPKMAPGTVVNALVFVCAIEGGHKAFVAALEGRLVLAVEGVHIEPRPEPEPEPEQPEPPAPGSSRYMRQIYETGRRGHPMHAFFAVIYDTTKIKDAFAQQPHARFEQVERTASNRNLAIAEQQADARVAELEEAAAKEAAAQASAGPAILSAEEAGIEPPEPEGAP